MNCRVCDSTHLELVIDLGAHVVNNLDEYPEQIVNLLNETNLVSSLEKNAKVVAANRDYRVTYQPIVDALETDKINHSETKI